MRMRIYICVHIIKIVYKGVGGINKWKTIKHCGLQWSQHYLIEEQLAHDY